MNDYRFRVEGALLVLQVRIPGNDYGDHCGQRESKWRDAKVEDIPVLDPFGSQQPWPQVSQIEACIR